MVWDTADTPAFRELERLSRIEWNAQDDVPPPPRECYECGRRVRSDPVWALPAWEGPHCPQRPVRYHRWCAFGPRVTSQGQLDLGI